jgi:carbon monoxide dehydrogenase subunit G
LTGHFVSLDGQEVKLGSSFHVPAEPGTVLDKFLDAPTMRACIPGCTELERPDESHFRGRLTNEIAHVRFDAVFSVEITELVPPHTVRAVLTAEDTRLGSSLKVNAALDVVAAGDGSDVTYAMELAMWGRLGRMGESIFRRRTAEVEEQFLQAFARACAGEDVAMAAAGPAPAPARSLQVTGSAPLGPSAAEPVPLAPGAVSAPAMSALPGVPFPVVGAAPLDGGPAARRATPAEAAAAAVASMRRISEEPSPSPLDALTRRPTARAGAVAALAALVVVLTRVLNSRKARR